MISSKITYQVFITYFLFFSFDHICIIILHVIYINIDIFGMCFTDTQYYQYINCFKFAYIVCMNNTTISNAFNGDNSNIAFIKTQCCQIMAIMAYRILKFEPMIKKRIVINHTYFAVVTFSRINCFAYFDSIVLQHL